MTDKSFAWLVGWLHEVVTYIAQDSLYIAEDDLEVLILLLLAPMRWNYRCMLPYPLTTRVRKPRSWSWWLRLVTPETPDT